MRKTRAGSKGTIRFVPPSMQTVKRFYRMHDEWIADHQGDWVVMDTKREAFVRRTNPEKLGQVIATWRSSYGSVPYVRRIVTREALQYRRSPDQVH